MYALIDQPVTRLCGGSRFVLSAMRCWADALARGSCPPGVLATPFLTQGVIDALPSFHRLMAALNRQARETVRVSPIPYHRVSEWEAILLGLWRNAAVAPARARATLRLVLQDDAAESAFEALVTAQARLVAGGVRPHGLSNSARTA